MTSESSLRSGVAACSVSVLIATKNRSSEVREALVSLAGQFTQPLEVIIVDQSAGDETARAVQEESKRSPGMLIHYIHDRSITGASAGRNRAMEHAKGTIWLFMDDDVVLEPNFLDEILNTYRDYPGATGVSGTVTNYAPPPLAARLFAAIFAWGPFHDERQPLYWNAEARRNAEPTQVRKFGAGMASFRAKDIGTVRFDLHPAAFGAEDVDFCLRLPRGSRLLLASRARCVHKQTQTARPTEHWLRASARATSFLYRKHWRKGIKNRICFRWLQVGYACAAFAGSIKRFSLEPWRALADGVSLAPSPR